jgi:hypothetical protein
MPKIVNRPPTGSKSEEGMVKYTDKTVKGRAEGDKIHKIQCKNCSE